MGFYKYHSQQRVETRSEASRRGQRDQLEGDPEDARKGFKLGLAPAQEILLA